MALTEYRRKRHFQRTPEPAGTPTKRRPAKAVRTKGLSFVIQKHDATRLHYDLRLEHEGVLKSWAVPKGPSLDPSEKRLAVEVEDHPLEYAKFEGSIPEGEYGAGEVIVWDRGRWIADGDVASALRRGKLEFELQGEKLQGGWRLLRLKDRPGESKHNWLLMKRTDDAARSLAEYDVTAERPESIKSGRLLDRDQAAQVKLNGKPKGRRPAAAARQAPRRKSSRKAGKKDRLPGSFQVQLAMLVAEPPSGDDWVHEVKFDGYRLVARLEGGQVALITRNQLDWTHRYSAVAAAVGKLPVRSAIVDGEVVAMESSGVSNFQALQNAMRDGSSSKLVYFAFDLLYLDGEDLRPQPLVERKSRLEKLITAARDAQLQYSEHFTDNGQSLLKECCRRGLEGIVSKRGSRPYVSGRTTDWLKIKCLLNEELVIGGFTRSTAAERGFGALLLGYFTAGQFVYAGRVGTGFDSKTLTDLRLRMDKLVQPKSPFVSIPPRERVPGIQWVRPELVAEIAFGSWTNAEVVRHASYLGLREDKPARDVGRPESLAGGISAAREETPAMPNKRTGRVRISNAQAGAAGVSDLPVALTNPQRVLWADADLTKADLARYYVAIADWILPHLAGRPLSMLRCPEGQKKPCFFQKHAAAGTPQALRRVDIEEKHESEVYLIADDLEGLLSLAQMSILEIHPWGSRADRLEQPDRIIFDLDPSTEVAWGEVVAAARDVRQSLEKLGLVSFVKTTGGKGLHVVAPLSPRRHEWPAVKAFTRAVAQHFADEQPDRFTANIAKAARKGKIFIDYLRNDRGATAIAPYSTRARPKAPVSTPLTWDELSGRIKSDHFRVANVPQRLKSLTADPWAGFFDVKQQLPKFVESA